MMEITLDIESSGLKPEEDFITCIGVGSEYGFHQFSAPASEFRSDHIFAEEHLLLAAREHCDILMGAHPECMITYNGIGFDVPFIDRRAGIQKIIASFTLPKTHVDVSVFVKRIFGRNTTKDEACFKLCNLYCPKMMAGLMLARLYKSGAVTDSQHIEMLQHNALDLGATLRMHRALKQFPDYLAFLEEAKTDGTPK